MQLMIAMLTATEEKLKTAAKRLCELLDLKDENAQKYVSAMVPVLFMWIGDNVGSGNIFL